MSVHFKQKLTLKLSLTIQFRLIKSHLQYFLDSLNRWAWIISYHANIWVVRRGSCQASKKNLLRSTIYCYNHYIQLYAKEICVGWFWKSVINNWVMFSLLSINILGGQFYTFSQVLPAMRISKLTSCQT